MNNRDIVLLTGAVHTGKTTALVNWCEGKRVGGFVTPVVDGLRVVQVLPSHECFPFETKNTADGIISIGRYHFLMDGFEYMNNLLQTVTSTESDWIVVDEVGPLELQGQGLHEGLTHALRYAACNVLLVVRESLVNEVIAKYTLANPCTITKENLPTLR
jgi:nucleoside-triphosphatase